MLLPFRLQLLPTTVWRFPNNDAYLVSDAATLIAIYPGYSKLKLVEDGRRGSLSDSKIVNQTGEELWQEIAFIE